MNLSKVTVIWVHCKKSGVIFLLTLFRFLNNNLACSSVKKSTHIVPSVSSKILQGLNNKFQQCNKQLDVPEVEETRKQRQHLILLAPGSRRLQTPAVIAKVCHIYYREGATMLRHQHMQSIPHKRTLDPIPTKN